MSTSDGPFFAIKSLFTDAVNNGEVTTLEYTTRLSEIFVNLSPETKKLLGQRVESEMRIPCKQVLEKHSSDTSHEKVLRELQLQIILVLHIRFLCLFEETEACADHELGDWITQLISRLSLCDPTSQEWKKFLKLEVVDRYKTAFGRTLFHVYLNLGLEPPECLPSDSELTSESHTLEENVDEVDGVMLESPEPLNMLQPSPVLRNTLRRSLPRALFTDSIHIPLSQKTPNLLTSTPTFSNVINSCPVNMESSNEYGSCKNMPTPQLVLIPCQRSKRKCRTPTKRISIKREIRRKPTNTTPTVRQRDPSAVSSKQTPSSVSTRRIPRSSNRSRSHSATTSLNSSSIKKSRLSEKSAPTTEKSKKKANANSKGYNNWRSVHETPNPDKSYPRWERARLAAAEKTKNKAIIIDESPIKPLLTTASPLRRLRRANSMLNSLLYIEAQEAAQTQGGLPTLLSNSSSLPVNSDDSQLTREPSIQFGHDLDIQHKDSCLSVAMSRAERWRRRQLEEEASLSQFSIPITHISNIQSDSVHVNSINSENVNTTITTTPRLLRRNSNLLANMTSSDYRLTTSSAIQLIHSPKRIKTPRKNIFNVAPKCTAIVDNNCAQLSTTVITTNAQTNSNCFNPVEIVTTPPNCVIKPSLQTTVNLSTPRRRTCAYKSKDVDDGNFVTNTAGRCSRRTRHSSGFIPSGSRETIVSPQVFDEEAMFLGREEFLNETTPNMSTRVEEDDDGAEFGALLMSRKRRKMSPVCSPLQPPVLRLNAITTPTTTSSTANVDQLSTRSPNCHITVESSHTPSPYSHGNNFTATAAARLMNAPRRICAYIYDDDTVDATTVGSNGSSVDYHTSSATVCTSDPKDSDMKNSTKPSVSVTVSVNSPLPFMGKPIKSPFAPLHIFSRPSNTVSDIVDTATMSNSQSNSSCIALRRRLFGGVDNESSNGQSNQKLFKPTETYVGEDDDNSENINPSSSSTPSSSVSSSKSHIPLTKPYLPISGNNSNHPWDESSIDMPLSPVLRQLQWNMETSVELTTTTVESKCHPYTTSLSDKGVFTYSRLKTTTIPTSTIRNQPTIRPRRTLFQ
ncbi:60S ribosomal L11 [Schistosoma japonicum]|uniref:60S ribosomal L11 n=1 Tax=Schistosoma japonicum TaxID=6182 RepID=A0A4Z2CQL9_SCHJA|nr:60S ribosomal L11 [Schistosoma japonicum]